MYSRFPAHFHGVTELSVSVPEGLVTQPPPLVAYSGPLGGGSRGQHFSRNLHWQSPGTEDTSFWTSLSDFLLPPPPPPGIDGLIIVDAVYGGSTCTSEGNSPLVDTIDLLMLA